MPTSRSSPLTEGCKRGPKWPLPMRVAHIELGRRLYGGAMQTFYLAQGLQAYGAEVLLVCARDGALHRFAERRGVKLLPIRYRGDPDATALPRMVVHLSRWRPTIVHAHSRRGADIYGQLAARLATRARVVLTRRVDNPIRGGFFDDMRFSYLPDWIVAVSKGIRRVLLQAGVPPERMSQIYSAIDPKLYRVPADPEEVKQAYGIAQESHVVAVIAQLIERKGHRVLIEAAPQILQTYPNVRFLFLGEGDERAQLEALVRTKGLSERVIFAGHCDEVGRALNAIDVLVHPALIEGFANVALQAMAAEIPVVSSAVGGMPESVRDGETGLLVPPGDPQALAAAVLRLLGDRALRRTVELLEPKFVG